MAIARGQIGPPPPTAPLAKFSRVQCAHRVSKAGSGRTLCRERGLGSLRNQTPLLLGEGSVQVEHERVGVSSELRTDKRHLLRHQAGHEGDVAGKTVQLRHHHAAFRGVGSSQSSSQLRPPVERVGPFSAFGLDVLADQEMPSASANRPSAARWAAIPNPERCCRCVETRK